MALVVDKLLTTQDDIRLSKFFTKNMKSEEIDPSIRNAQMIEIRNFLGGALYTALLGDYTEVSQTFATQRFTDLWQGVSFTPTGSTYPEQYRGLQYSLHWYAIERLLHYENMKTYRSGQRTMTSEFSEAAFTKSYQVSSDSMGLMHQRDAEIFLNTKKTDYPEWKPTGENETGFKLFKVTVDKSY